MTPSRVLRFGAFFVVAALVVASLAVLATAPAAVASSAHPSAALTVPAAPAGRSAPHLHGHSYGVTFSESGLPANQVWQVTVGRSTSSTTTDGSTDYLGFFESNGTYAYVIADISGWHQTTLAYHGNVVVNGAAVSEPTLVYSEVLYTVTFSESGLPSGETFQVTYNGSPQAVTTDGGTDSLAFSTPNGSFPYAIADVSGWHQATLPYHGTVVVNGASIAKPTLAYSQVVYSVSFSESGLPSGQTFGVTFDGTPKSLTTNGALDTLTWTGYPNGSYAYSVANVAGWHQTTLPYHGSVAVAGSNVATATLVFTKAIYSVVFSESGLPAGETFQVTVNHGGVESVTTDGATDSLLFTETNGTYTYAISTVSGWSQPTIPYHGSFTVNGSSVTEPTVVFFQVTYTVTYTESGLPDGTNWSVTFNAVTANSTGPSISFTVPNGSYAFKVGYVAGYATSPTFGSQPVAGADLDLSVPFVQVTYAVTFSETGLPAGTSWSASTDSRTLTSTTAEIVFDLPNGTFGYDVPAVPGYVPVQETGSVTVDGSAASVSVPFSLVTYSVTFHETGLPTTHPKAWTVSLDDATQSLTANSIVFTVGNGTYTYLIRGPGGYRVSSVLPPEGTVTVSGTSPTIDITFLKGSTGTVAFHEKGLATGTDWCVTFGATLCSTAAKIAIPDLTPGTYSYAIRGVSGLTTLVKQGPTPLPTSGSIALAHSASFVVTFAYAVTFTETGLAGGTEWKVAAGGSAVESTTNTIVLYLKNGTYSFGVAKVSGKIASPKSGSFRVAGATVAISIRFTAAPAH